MFGYIAQGRRISGGGGGPWTPANIATELWLDASDASTLNSGAGGDVTSWADKSGNSRNASASTAAPRDTTAFPLTSLYFNGSRRFTVSYADAFRSTGGLSVFGVLKYDSTTTNKGWIGKWISGSLDWYFGLFSSELLFGVRAGGSSVNAPGIGGTLTTAMIISGVIDAGVSISSFRNGVGSGVALGAVDGPASGGVAIGSYSTDAGVDMIGKIGEVVVVNGAASTDVRQKIEGYFAHKWGLVSALPGDHPFKDAAP